MGQLVKPWLQPQTTLYEFLPTLWMGYAAQSSQGCGYPNRLFIFFYYFFLPLNLPLVYFDKAPCDHNPSLAMAFDGLPSLWKVTVSNHNFFLQ